MKNPTVPDPVRAGRAAIGFLASIVAITGCTVDASGAAPIETVAASAAALAGTHSVTVSVGSVEGDDGDIRVALYSTREGFDAREPIASASEPAAAPTVTVSFENLPDGDYAVMLFHDVDGDETLDRNLLGVPREPWTGSLNGPVFGAPGWDDVRFEVDGGDLVLTLFL